MGAANIVRALGDNFTMYVLQSCNACTIEKLSCMYLAIHAQCGGTGTAFVQALQCDGRISRAYIGCLHRLLRYDISRLYPKAGKIMALIRPQRFRFALLQQHHRHADITQLAHRHRYSMTRCWIGPYYSRTTQLQSHGDSTAPVLSFQCCLENILRWRFFLPDDVSSYVTAWKNILYSRAVAFCWPTTARRCLSTKNRVGAAYYFVT
jgi:hypothetical protein